MEKLLLVFLFFCCGGTIWAQPADDHEMESIDSLILVRHHYDPRIVKIDTAYYLNSQKVSEHYFIDTTTNALERAVVQVYHTPTSSTIEYYFFLNNTLARVQTQEYREEEFGQAEIHYFQNDEPIDCKKKEKRPCDNYLQKAREMISWLQMARS